MENICAKSHRDPLVGRHLKERCRDVAIFPAGELVSRFDDRDSAAKAPIGLRQFHPYVAPQSRSGGRKAIEFEDLDVGQRLRRR